jgi:hypothetical protein
VGKIAFPKMDTRCLKNVAHKYTNLVIAIRSKFKNYSWEKIGFSEDGYKVLQKM